MHYCICIILFDRNKLFTTIKTLNAMYISTKELFKKVSQIQIKNKTNKYVMSHNYYRVIIWEI